MSRLTTPTSRARRLLPWAAGAAGAVLLATFFAVLPTPPADGEGKPAAAAETPATPSGTFAVTGVRVFDGERVLARADVLVEDGLVATVGPGLDLPPGVARVDGAGRTLLPGLIDAHVHAMGGGLEPALRFGVTTVLDMFAEPAWAASVRERQAADGNPGAADLYSAGMLATAPGGHGTQFGVTVPAVDAGTDAGAWVAARLAEGSDYVKIVLEDGHTLGLDLPTLDGGQVAALAAAAHRRGLLAVAHVGSAAEAATALGAGVDGLVHLVVDRPLDEATVRRAAAAGAFAVPTLTVLESVTGGRGGAALAGDALLGARLEPAQLAGLRRSFPAHMHGGDLAVAFDSVRRLAAAGVPILAGSDAPNPGTAHGASLHRELELLVAAGLTPAAALAAATAAPARAFGLADRGRVAPGLRADLVLVDGDPTADVTATRALVAVWKQGQAAALAAPAAELDAGEVPVVAAGLVSDFSQGTDARVGPSSGPTAGWFGSTDERMGGASTVELAVDDGALAVAGEVRAGSPYPWAGAMVFTGAAPMQPADLSAARGFALRARSAAGEAGTATLRLFLFSPQLGPTPAVRSFDLGPAWKRYEVAFEDFGVDAASVSGLLVTGGAEAGPFRLWIDDVELVPAADGGAGSGTDGRR